MKKSTIVKCWRCKGGGSLKLFNYQLELINLASTHPNAGITAHSAWVMLDPKANMVQSAFNNRLNKLFKLGLLTRKHVNGDKKTFVYFNKERK